MVRETVVEGHWFFREPRKRGEKKDVDTLFLSCSRAQRERARKVANKKNKNKMPTLSRFSSFGGSAGTNAPDPLRLTRPLPPSRHAQPRGRIGSNSRRLEREDTMCVTSTSTSKSAGLIGARLSPSLRSDSASSFPIGTRSHATKRKAAEAVKVSEQEAQLAAWVENAFFIFYFFLQQCSLSRSQPRPSWTDKNTKR